MSQANLLHIFSTCFAEGLKLFKNHFNLFAEYVYPESQWWNTTLIKWLELGTDNRIVAIECISVFHQQMADTCAERRDSQSTCKVSWCIRLRFFTTLVYN